MAQVCELCGMKSDMPERHATKYDALHKAILARREEEAKPLPAPPVPETVKESILNKAAKWLKT